MVNCSKIFVFFVFVFLSNVLLAQVKVDSILTKEQIKKVIFSGNHFGFNIAYNVVAKGSVAQNDLYNPYSKTSTGILLGINYNINFNANVSLNTGVNIGLSGRNFWYNISKDAFTPALSNNVASNSFLSYQTPINFLQLPLHLEKRWFKTKNFFYATTGLNVSFTLNDFYETADIIVDNNGSTTRIVRAETDFLEQKRLLLNYSIGYGYAIITKTNNINKIGVMANISFNDISSSTYTFTIPNQPVFAGNFTSSGTYIGIYYSRLFTNANYRIRKMMKL